MEIFGLVALALVLCYSGYPARIKKLETELKKIKTSVKGENAMSRLIESLRGQECIIECNEALLITGKTSITCQVLDVDDEWVKISFTDKHNKTKIMRIENISNIELKA